MPSPLRFKVQADMGILYSKIRAVREGARAGLRVGADRAAALVEAEAKRLVPVDTGNLRDHIHTGVSIDKPTRQQREVTPTVEAANDWGFDPPYARRIELGFFGADRLGRVYHQPARPYMRPAYDAMKAPGERVIAESVLEGARAAGGGR